MRAREDGRARDRAWNSDGLAAIEPINELLGVVPKAKAESEHHPVRCLRSSTCANRAGEFSGTTGRDRPINAAMPWGEVFDFFRQRQERSCPQCLFGTSKQRRSPPLRGTMPDGLRMHSTALPSQYLKHLEGPPAPLARPGGDRTDAVHAPRRRARAWCGRLEFGP